MVVEVFPFHAAMVALVRSVVVISFLLELNGVRVGVGSEDRYIQVL